jgi:hypothetical protein
VQRDEYLPARVAEMLWGVGDNARLIFPAQLAKRLSPAKLDTLLLHELAHFARRDHWLRALELAACVIYWWNPLVWWARREIELAEEECCDAWVVERQNGVRHSYAEALLTTVDFLCERRAIMPPAACGLGEVALLRARLTQIMRGQAAARLSRWVQTLVLSAGLLLSSLQPALWATSSPSVTSPRATESFTALPRDITPGRPTREAGTITTHADKPLEMPSVSAESSSSLRDLVVSRPRPTPVVPNRGPHRQTNHADPYRFPLEFESQHLPNHLFVICSR